ncbi:MAG: hypothetical protein ABH824_00695 [Nanoarchaeota archaeon]|nr:hypothetical protein [Nanoarchaeota archaeon]MBU1631669.1 hypothetical protein [Nanoarchaeota archaeon]MBU1875639.1 hypothetical protein [Nanoarchaeota archaeon]
MELLNQILVLLFSLTGIIFGIALSYIAPEELSFGKKYLILLKMILIAISFSVVVFYLFPSKEFYLLIFFVTTLVAVFSLESKVKNKYYPLFYYPAFIITYFFYNDDSFKLILASIIFFYGFPIGTLLKTNFKKNEK